MPTWPASLPQSMEVEGYQESFPEQRLSSGMEIGPPKVRRRTTAAPTPISGQIVLDATQLATLETFIDSDLAGGALAFDMPHPRTGATISVVLSDQGMPVVRPILGGTKYVVRLDLEKQP